MSSGKVYLAGGGCGDAGLVTMRAVEALQSCDTVVYDSLVSQELLQWTRPDCERIYVGKRYQRHSRKQTEINALLIEKAREGKTVVRLKGGDPYMFGRGGEEFMALRDAGICCEVISGVTSAIAAPAAAGIPVTHRGLSDSVTVVTGTAAETDGQEQSRLDFQTLARLKGTLVILMGMHHLDEIAAGLLGAGKDPHTPCAIVMEGTTEGQRVLRAPLSALYTRAVEQGFASPAVIVVGAVAELSLTTAEAGAGGVWEAEDSGGPATSDREAEVFGGPAASDREAEVSGGPAVSDRAERERRCMLPLKGTSVGVTGTARFAGRMASALREKGADVWDMSFMEIRPAQDPLPDFSACGWLVFTSPNGVKVFLDKMRQEKRDLRRLSDQKIAVIGPGTAEALQEAGLYADYMPDVYDAEHLARGLADVMEQEADQACLETGREETSQKTDEKRYRRTVFLRAKQGSDLLPRIFDERGIPYTEYPLYSLGVQEDRRDAVICREPDYIVFGSAMGADAYFEGLEQKGIQNTKSRYVCIGEWCAREVYDHVETPPLTAEEATVDAVAACLCREAQERGL